MAATLLQGAIYLAFAFRGDQCEASRACAAIFALFDLNAEAAIPTWFSAGLWLLAAVIAGAVALQTGGGRRQGDRYWRVLAVLFLFLSLDEVAAFHEEVGILISTRVHLGGFFGYPWVLYGIGLSGTVGLASLPFLSRLSPRVRWTMLAAGVVYVVGALGFEMLGAAAENGTIHLASASLWPILIAAEELCEMFGVILLIDALMVQADLDAIELHVAFRR